MLGVLAAPSESLPANKAQASDKAAKSAAMRLGRMKAMSCASCHGMDGKGIERDGEWVAPGYDQSEILRGDPETLARIILKGIASDSDHYSSEMAGMERIYDDRSLAAVMTWVRNRWGGHDDFVSSEQAATYRERFADQPGPVALGAISE